MQPPQRDPSKPQPMNMKNVFRAMSVIFVPVAFSMPAGVLMYWSTTNVFGLIQRGAFAVPAVQKFLGWPLPEEMPGYSSSSRASGSSEVRAVGNVLKHKFCVCFECTRVPVGRKCRVLEIYVCVWAEVRKDIVRCYRQVSNPEGNRDISP